MGGKTIKYDPNAYVKTLVDRSFECSSCGKSMNEIGNLRKHVEKHRYRKRKNQTKQTRNKEKLKPCSKPNKCLKKQHPDGKCHVATESGYISYEGIDPEDGVEKWMNGF